MLINFKDCSNIIKILHGTTLKSVYHIGAHEGQEAQAYYENGVEKVIWFEANTDLIETLKDNINNYSLDSQIIPYALWNENTELDFNITNFNQSSSFFELGKHSEYYPNITVEAKKKIKAFRLDSLLEIGNDFLKWHDFDFINIDTQGSELAILQGLGKYLSLDSLKGIYLEVNAEQLYKGIPVIGEIDTYLAQFNFLRCKTVWSNAGWGDALYVKPSTTLNF
jgi:FkbM family methyltransferase